MNLAKKPNISKTLGDWTLSIAILKLVKSSIEY
jgi:hypothetical protein